LFTAGEVRYTLQSRVIQYSILTSLSAFVLIRNALFLG